MSLFKISMIAVTLLSPALAFSKTLRVSTSADSVNMMQMQYREATTRDKLPGCSWYDVLQGSGWFPATFYSDVSPETDGEAVVYNFGKQSILAKYCGAKTDNVANYIQFTIPNVNDAEGEVYGGVPLKFGTSEQSKVEVNCTTIDEGFGLQVTCDEAAFSNAADLELVLNFVE